jgi:hypothetical protein
MVLGNEDIYIFQNRNEAMFYLWHPSHGIRALDNSELNLGRKGLERFAISPDGSRLHFVTKFKDFENTNEETGTTVTEIESVKLKATEPEALFGAAELEYQHDSYTIPGDFQVASTDKGLVLHMQFDDVYFEYLYGHGDTDAAFSKRSLPHRFSRIQKFGDYLAGHAMMTGGLHFIFLNSAGEIIFGLGPNEDEPLSPQAAEIQSFIQAFYTGSVKIGDTSLSYLNQNQEVILDLSSLTFRKYLSGIEVSDFAHPDKRMLVQKTDQIFSVTTIDPAQRLQQRGSPLETITITSEYRYP